MYYAPIALFVYNRPWHTRQTVEALQANAEASKTPLYVFSDAPIDPTESKAVTEVRSFLREITGFKSLSIIERENNFGLARSITDGVTRVCEKHGRAIALEDDIVVSPYFLMFMNDGLRLYRDARRVISIHGYQYPIKAELPETFFLRGADCWGWATWKRGWDLFEADGRVLIRELIDRRLSHYFDYDGAYPYTRMLRQQIKEKNDSWAIRWHASAFLRDMLTLYPARSLVMNIGTDGSGTHCLKTNEFTGEFTHGLVRVEPIPVEENLLARQQIVRFHRSSRPNAAARLARRLARAVGRAV